MDSFGFTPVLMDLSILPTVNAALNATSALLLVLGYTLIRQRAITGHTICMLGACGTSAIFLVSYLTYHFFHGATRFPGQGPVRLFYFSILISHTFLAICVVPLVIFTLVFAFRSRFDKHAALARVTLPVWLYVSVTGVVVYWMLYRVVY
jgi:putative membrane protein